MKYDKQQKAVRAFPLPSIGPEESMHFLFIIGLYSYVIQNNDYNMKPSSEELEGFRAKTFCIT